MKISLLSWHPFTSQTDLACKVTTWNLENNSAHRCDLVESGKESLLSATTGGLRRSFGAAFCLFEDIFTFRSGMFLHIQSFMFLFLQFLHVYSTPKTPIVMASHHDIILHSIIFHAWRSGGIQTRPGQGKTRITPLDHSMNHVKLPPHFLSWGRRSAIWPSNLIELPFLQIQGMLW